MWVTAPLEADSSEVFLPCSVSSRRHTNSRGVRMTVILSLRTPRLELSRGRCLAQQGPLSLALLAHCGRQVAGVGSSSWVPATHL